MKIENPAALRFIMQDEIYLLSKDKTPNRVPELPPTDVITAPVSFNYSGRNKKKFLILVHYPEQEFIDDKHLVALENILKRLEYTLDDAAIFNRAAYADVTFEKLMDFFGPQKLLLLGADSLPAGMETITVNTPKQLNNCSALFSFSFGEMMDNNDYKKLFWEQLKKL